MIMSYDNVDYGLVADVAIDALVSSSDSGVVVSVEAVAPSESRALTLVRDAEVASTVRAGAVCGSWPVDVFVDDAVALVDMGSDAVDESPIEVDGSIAESVVSEPDAPTEQTVVLQICGELPLSAALDCARELSRKYGVVVVRDAGNGAIVTRILPGMGKASKPVRAVREGKPVVVKEPAGESALDLRRRGVWADSDLDSSPQNATILGVKHRIEAAMLSGDRAALEAMSFVGAKIEDEKRASTYYRQAGAYLRWALATGLADTQAKLDAEFGSFKLAAD